MGNVDDEFNELVRKAERVKKYEAMLKEEAKKEKAYIVLLIVEFVLSLTGFVIMYFAVGGLATLGLFILLTGNNLQILRNIKKNLFKWFFFITFALTN